MGNISSDYFKRYRYTLDGPFGPQVIAAPVGWDSDRKKFKRGKAHGLLILLSNDLKFYKGDQDNDGGFDYLKRTFDIYGVNAQVTLKREEDLNGTWVEDYNGDLSYANYERGKDYLKLRFSSSGIYEQIKARRKNSIELGRTTTMEGEEIPALKTDLVALEGRDILLLGQMEKNTTIGTYPGGDNRVVITEDLTQCRINHGKLGKWEAICVPMSMVANQDGSAQTVTDFDIDEEESSYGKGKGGNMFYAVASDDDPLTIDWDLEFEVSPDEYSPDLLRIDLVKFKDGETYNFDSYQTLVSVPNPVRGATISYKQTSSIETEIGTSYALAIHTTKSNKDGIVAVDILKANVTVRDRTFFEASQAKFVLAFEAWNRVLHIITGVPDLLVSKALGRTDLGYAEDGVNSGALNGITTGELVRKFEDANITMSFDDLNETFGALWQTGFGIEKIGRKTIFRLEHIRHFYQEIVTIVIPAQPKKILRKLSKDHYWGSLEIGFSKPQGEILYEESQGLEEYNILNSYGTAITGVENTFSSKSPSRGDSLAKEFARRKPRQDYPTTDTRYDKDLMIMDLKRGVTGIFQERKWGDDFIIPSPFNEYTTGVYSPETATNLRLSPMNTLRRWDFWIGACLEKNQDDYIRYNSGRGNTGLKTQAIGSDTEYAENGEIKNSDLGKQFYRPEIITFEYPIDSEMIRTLKGYIKIGDDYVLRVYGLVSFINYDNMIEFGYLLSAEPNGEGKWELLSSTKKPIPYVDNNPPIDVPTTREGFDYDLEMDLN